MSYNDSCCWSVAARDVQGAVVVVDSEETVVAGYWKDEDVAEGASDAVVAVASPIPTPCQSVGWSVGITFIFLFPVMLGGQMDRLDPGCAPQCL